MKCYWSVPNLKEISKVSRLNWRKSSWYERFWSFLRSLYQEALLLMENENSSINSGLSWTLAIKKNILRNLPAEEFTAKYSQQNQLGGDGSLSPTLIFISNGPGDPAVMEIRK